MYQCHDKFTDIIFVHVATNVDSLLNIYMLEMFSTILTYKQMRRIRLGLQEKITVSKSVTTVELKVLHTLGTNCTPTINDHIVSEQELHEFTHSRPVQTSYCSTVYQTRLYLISIANRKDCSAVYGFRCTGWRQDQGLVIPEESEINLEVLFEDSEAEVLTEEPTTTVTGSPIPVNNPSN